MRVPCKLPANLRVTTLARVNSVIQSIKSEIAFMNCLNVRAVLIALASAEKQTISEVVSLLLGRDAYATYHDGLIYKLECVPTTSVLLR